MKIISIIPARGGSKGIPKKNIIDLNGKPLIAWTIEASLNSKYINKTVVTSDNDEILNISKKYGAKTIKRPDELAQDNSRTEPVITHALEFLNENYDFVVILQPTSPLRTKEHIDEAIEKFIKNKSLSLFSVSEPSHSALKAFVLSDNGTLEGIRNNDYPFMPRQKLPKTFYPNGAIYIVDAKAFLDTQRLFFDNSTTYYEMSEKDSIDIDSFDDLNNLNLRIV